jgi:[NiFe] hydrogenase diaphorase moiety large subunit
MVGAQDTVAVQMGGASGQMLAPPAFGRSIEYDDAATGGAVTLFGNGRNVLEIASRYMEFFIHESCGYCTPCRAGNVLLKERVDRILAGKGEPADLTYLSELGQLVKTASRCGLGQTSPNPVLTTLENFRPAYERMVRERTDGIQPAFDLRRATADAAEIAGHGPARCAE